MDTLQLSLTSIVENINIWINIYTIILSIIGLVYSTKQLLHLWHTRHLRKVWGIRNGDYVIVVCSELKEPEERQRVEKREFIYSLKYGDVDAYFEVVITLLRLYPKIKLRIMSSGEAEKSKVNLEQHLILIGGPDYNKITERFLKMKITQFQYLSPYLRAKSKLHPKEIVLWNTFSKREYCFNTDENDYGYFEQIRNPHNPENKIILLGGCHTIGVTGAIKAFSMAESEKGEIPKMVLINAKKVAQQISNKSEYSVLLSVDRVGQTINTPVIKGENVIVRNN